MAYTIGLPIGHGEDTYENTGGKGINGWEEFWFNEKVGKYAHDRLIEHGFKVVVPQKWDANEVSLWYKSNTLDAAETDLNVAIHANAGPEDVEGACVFYWKGSEGGKKFADIWLKNFKEMCPEQGLHGNGQHVSQRGSWTNFHIIRETDAVTDLIEHGFFTDPDNLKNLKSDDFRRRCAEVIVKSVCEYFGQNYKSKPKGRPNPLDDGEWRLATGLFSDANSYDKAIEEFDKIFPGWLRHEKAKGTGFNPRYRIISGIIIGRNVAEYYAEILREKTGWNVHVIKR